MLKKGKKEGQRGYQWETGMAKMKKKQKANKVENWFKKG